MSESIVYQASLFICCCYADCGKQIISVVAVAVLYPDDPYRMYWIRFDKRFRSIEMNESNQILIELLTRKEINYLIL